MSAGHCVGTLAGCRLNEAQPFCACNCERCTETRRLAWEARVTAEQEAPHACEKCRAVVITGAHTPLECLTAIATALVKERDAAYQALSQASVDRDELARFVMRDEARSAEWIARGAGCAVCQCPDVARRPDASAELVALSMVLSKVGSWCKCGLAASSLLVGTPVCDTCLPSYLDGCRIYWETTSPPGSVSRRLGYPPREVEILSCVKVARRFNALLGVSETSPEPSPETEPKATPDQGPSR